jgi:hypothetical protein
LFKKTKFTRELKSGKEEFINYMIPPFSKSERKAGRVFSGAPNTHIPKQASLTPPLV